MYKNIIFGQYIFSKSILHAANPCVKTLLLILFIISMFFIQNYLGILLIFLYTIILSVVVGFRKRDFIKTLKFSLIFIFFSVFSSIFKDDGSQNYILIKIPISYFGLELALKNATKIFIVILMSVLITRTTTPLEFVRVINKTSAHFKNIKFINIKEIGFILVISVRFIPIIFEEVQRIINAQKTRGIIYNTTSIISAVKNFTGILVPLFVSTFRRAESLSMAIDSRCYGMTVQKSYPMELKYTLADVKLLISSLIILVISVLI